MFARKTKNTRIIQPINVYNNISQVKTIVKYLGVNLDSKFTNKIHIKTVLRKTYSVMKQLYPLRAKGSAVSSYSSLYLILRPIITYAAPAWCGAANTNLKPLQNYQNKCLRLVLNKGRYARIIELHEQTHIPLIKDYIMETAEKFYHKQLKHNRLTENITNIRYNNMPTNSKYELSRQKLQIFKLPRE